MFCVIVSLRRRLTLRLVLVLLIIMHNRYFNDENIYDSSFIENRYKIIITDVSFKLCV